MLSNEKGEAFIIDNCSFIFTTCSRSPMFLLCCVLDIFISGNKYDPAFFCQEKHAEGAWLSRGTGLQNDRKRRGPDLNSKCHVIWKQNGPLKWHFEKGGYVRFHSN